MLFFPTLIFCCVRYSSKTNRQWKSQSQVHRIGHVTLSLDSWESRLQQNGLNMFKMVRQQSEKHKFRQCLWILNWIQLCFVSNWFYIVAQVRLVAYFGLLTHLCLFQTFLFDSQLFFKFALIWLYFPKPNFCLEDPCLVYFTYPWTCKYLLRRSFRYILGVQLPT